MRTTTRSMLAASAATAVFAGGTLAQTDGTFLLVSTNTVSPATPTTTIEIWAAWVDLPRPVWLFVGGNYDLTAGDGVFSNPTLILQGPGTSAGVANGNTITGAHIGQLHIPSFFFGLEDNPILLATYDWTTTDFTPRAVSLDTSNTTSFMVAAIATGATLQLYPDEFTPGSGVINVVPTPAAWPLGVLLLAGVRRRRS